MSMSLCVPYCPEMTLEIIPDVPACLYASLSVLTTLSPIIFLYVLFKDTIIT